MPRGGETGNGAMNIELTPLECRVIGCLIEKEITTPDYYPLSLNALTNACNQKSNRDPVLDLDEATVLGVVEGLKDKHLVVEKSGFGSRVPKFKHRFCNTEFGSVRLDPQELGIVCALLLRGPQTPGELRTHCARLCSFPDVAAVEAAVGRLMEREDGPWVARLPREPGKREARYVHLLTDAEATLASATAAATEADGEPPDAADTPRRQDRIAALEARVEALEQTVATLREHLGGD